jgi:nucleoside-diphosphate-sugar epimerase
MRQLNLFDYPILACKINSSNEVARAPPRKLVNRNRTITKILITGANGFVGSHILETLMNIKHQDLEIVAACRTPSKLIPQFTGEVRQGDLRDSNYLDRVLVGIDIICHAAGWSSFEKSGNHCNQAYLEPTLDLINHALEWRVSRFINLSSIYVAASLQRDNADVKGKPRAHWPMINCHIAIEDYLREYHRPRCQFINLRLGLYSGKRINMGLLPLLLARIGHTSLPYITGELGHLPLVDGRDIGQAFARAALGPFESSYSSLNIVGPEVATHADVMNFIKNEIEVQPLSFALPSSLASPLIWLQGKTRKQDKQSLFTSPMLDILKSPVINNTHAAQQMGYDPEISWQASLFDTLDLYKNQSLNFDISQPERDLNI